MIWVSGASGLVGSHIVALLASQKKQVRAVYRSGESKLHALKAIHYFWKGQDYSSYIDWFQGDLKEYNTLVHSLQGIRKIFHCAAYVSFQGTAKNPELLETNHHLTEAVVNAALQLNIPRLVFVSSTAALTTDLEIGISETDFAINPPPDGYALSKWKGELEVWRGAEEGLSVLVVSPSVILGAGNPNQSSNDLFKKIGNNFPFYSDGTVGFVDVRDVARMTVELDKKGVQGERFVLGGHNTRYGDLFRQVALALGTKPPKWKVTPVLAEWAWRVAAVMRFFGKETGITRKTARKSQKTIRYNSNKILNKLETSFTDLEDTVAYCARFYKINHPSRF